MGGQWPGKWLDIKGTLDFYPVETQGHHLHTFLDTMQEDFRKIKKTKILPRPWRNLSQGEKRALKSLSENKNIIIRAAERGVAIKNFEDYKKEAYNILADNKYYEKL